MTSSDNTALYREALDLVAAKTLEDENSIGAAFPYVTHPDGSWDLMSSAVSAGYTGENWDHGNWFCGFWVGLLLAAHLHTKDKRYLDLAHDRMVLVAERADDGNTHDIGFIFLSSALPFHRMTQSVRCRELGLRAADKLRSRLIVTRKGAYVSSWGPLDDPRGQASSAIDTMANIPLLYWAATESGDASFRLAGEAHAKMTMAAFRRPDATLYHAVEYDTVSGDRLRGYTFQGYGDESAWSRGTGWAVYGLAASAAASGDASYLDQAIELAEKWFAQLGGKTVPAYDFDAPSGDAPEDSSASAIMAAALLDLASLHPDPAIGDQWNAKAHHLLAGLCADYLALAPSHRGILKHGCYSKPHNKGADAAVMFGDYFFVEALMRVLKPGDFVPSLKRLK
ncbi:MAG: glycoside hydrolase family 88 protein [Geminicoccales bacterium]